MWSEEGEGFQRRRERLALGRGGVGTALRLIVGRAGSGKTEACLRESLQALAAEGPEGRPLVLLAPEQATHQLDRALLDRLPEGQAVARLQVLSFVRLAAAVLAESGDAVQPRLSRTGSRMAMRAALRAMRASLPVFGDTADRPGFAETLGAQLRELEAYALGPAEIRALVDVMPPRTAARLSDLALLWDAHRRLLGNRAREPGSDLAGAAAALPRCSLARARCWVDGFAGFTAREEQVLAAWLCAGADLHVALCLDPDDAGGQPPEDAGDDDLHAFAPTRATLRRLTDLARRAGLPPPTVTALRGNPPRRFAASPDLAALEVGLWGPPAADAPPVPGARTHPRGVFIRRAADPQAEAEACAAEIDRLCRLEGYRYREVAVVLRELDAYRDLLTVSCARRGIPLFVDRERPAARHPVAQVLLAAAEVVASDWSTASVRNLLQCDLCGLDRDQADALDLLATAQGAFGSDWYGEGDVGYPPGGGPDRDMGGPTAAAGGEPPEDDPRTWRRRMAAPVRRLQRALGAGSPAREAAAACHRFLLDVGAPRAVARWMREAEDAGSFDLAAWHRQCWDAVVAMLDEMALALGGEVLPPAELAAALQSAIEDLTVGLVPPSLDQVLCGGVERSRHPAIRVVFVLGMGDGLFPPAPREGAILGDSDRLALRAAGARLAPTSSERLLHERYLAYIALTRASERVYLSYPASSGPSDVLLRVREAVPGAAEWGDDCPDARAGLAALAGEVVLRRREGGISPAWHAAEEWLRADAGRLESAGPVLAALEPRVRPGLSPDLASALYDEAFSPTRLEAMATCPFQHFARYGLRLRERQEARVDPSHLGLLLHAALAAFVRGLMDDRLDPAGLEEAEAERRAEQALRGCASQVLAHLPRGSARGAHLLRAAGRDLRRAVEALRVHAAAGRYRPVGVEVPLRGALRGFIDRLDEARDEAGTPHVRVIDYKTGAATFRLEAFADDVDLAPVLYLEQALAARTDGALPGGFFILPVRDELALVVEPGGRPASTPRLQGVAPAEQEARALHEAALDGSVTGVRTKADGTPYRGAPAATRTQFGLLLRAARRRVGRLRAAAAAGRCAPYPYRNDARAACATCALLAVCRFDPVQGDRYRWMRRGDPWKRLEAEDGREGSVVGRPDAAGGEP